MNDLFLQIRLSLPYLLLLFISCTHSDQNSGDGFNENNIIHEDSLKVPQTIFNEENHSTDYGDIEVTIGDLSEKDGVYFVEVKVETNRENYQIEIVGNLIDGQGNIRGPRIDGFFGPKGFKHLYKFEQLEGFTPYLILVSIYNPIDGNWNDLKYMYF